MGTNFLRIIGAFVMWLFSGFNKKYSDFLKPNIYATLIGILVVFIVAYLVFS